MRKHQYITLILFIFAITIATQVKAVQICIPNSDVLCLEARNSGNTPYFSISYTNLGSTQINCDIDDFVACPTGCININKDGYAKGQCNTDSIAKPVCNGNTLCRIPTISSGRIVTCANSETCAYSCGYTQTNNNIFDQYNLNYTLINQPNYLGYCISNPLIDVTGAFCITTDDLCNYGYYNQTRNAYGCYPGNLINCDYGCNYTNSIEYCNLPSQLQNETYNTTQNNTAVNNTVHFFNQQISTVSLCLDGYYYNGTSTFYCISSISCPGGVESAGIVAGYEQYKCKSASITNGLTYYISYDEINSITSNRTTIRDYANNISSEMILRPYNNNQIINGLRGNAPFFSSGGYIYFTNSTDIQTTSYYPSHERTVCSGLYINSSFESYVGTIRPFTEQVIDAYATNMLYFDIEVGADPTLQTSYYIQDYIIEDNETYDIEYNTWYYVCGVFDGTNTSYIYINGVSRDIDRVSYAFDPSYILYNSSNTSLTSQYFSTSYAKYVAYDEIRAYNRGLTPDEILELYNSYFPASVSKAPAFTLTLNESINRYRGNSTTNILPFQNYSNVYVYDKNVTQTHWIINSNETSGTYKLICDYRNSTYSTGQTLNFSTCINDYNCGFRSSRGWNVESSKLNIYNSSNVSNTNSYYFKPTGYNGATVVTFDYYPDSDTLTGFTIIYDQYKELATLFIQESDNQLCFYYADKSYQITDKTLLNCIDSVGVVNIKMNANNDGTFSFSYNDGTNVYTTTTIRNALFDYDLNLNPFQAIKIFAVDTTSDTFIGNINADSVLETQLDMDTANYPTQEVCDYKQGSCFTARLFFSTTGNNYNNYVDKYICVDTYSSLLNSVIKTPTDTETDETANFLSGGNLSPATKYIIVLIVMAITIGLFAFAGGTAGFVGAGFIVGTILGVFELIIFTVIGWIDVWILLTLVLVSLMLLTFKILLSKDTGGG